MKRYYSMVAIMELKIILRINNLVNLCNELLIIVTLNKTRFSEAVANLRMLMQDIDHYSSI